MFVDELERGAAHDSRGKPCPVEESANWQFLSATMDAFGLEGSYCLSAESGQFWLGLTEREVLDFAASADVLINVMGYLRNAELLRAVRMRAFVDIDPGFAQMWRQLGQADVLSGHDAFVTVGMNVGRPGCGVPGCGLDWIAIRPPVVLDLWPVAQAVTNAVVDAAASEAPSAEPLTSVCTWRGPFAPVEFGNQTYGLRVHEFRRLVHLPAATGRDFELAIEIDKGDASDLALLVDNGWKVVSPSLVAPDPFRYRDYIQRSGAELLVPKQMYVATRGGWMSDRTVCYLASGKPVVAQDTGWTDHYDPGAGLVPFRTTEEAITAVEDVCSRPAHHRAAARALAEELFDSDTVLGGLLTSLGLS
jgi:hypothetical protein